MSRIRPYEYLLAEEASGLDAYNPGAGHLLTSTLTSRYSTQIIALSTRVGAAQRAKEDLIDWRTYGYSPGKRCNFKVRRTLRVGGRVSALSWGSDGCHLATVSYDGKLILWNALMESKSAVVTLAHEWPLTVDVDPVSNERVVVAGVSCLGAVYKMEDLAKDGGLRAEPMAMLGGESEHTSYISSARFLAPDTVATASGDGTAKVWDLVLGQCLTTLGKVAKWGEGAGSPLQCMARHPMDPEMVTAGCGDGYVRLWDLRSPTSTHAVLSLSGFQGPVSGVDYFPSGMALAACGEDSTVRMFDVRTCGAVGMYADEQLQCGATGVSFSKSGSLLFASYESGMVVCWEPLSADGFLHELKGHDETVSCLAVNPEGQALATGGWDAKICLWA